MHGKVPVYDPLLGRRRHPCGPDLVEATTEPLLDRLPDVAVQVLEAANAVGAQVTVPVAVSAHDPLDIVGGDPQVDEEFPSAWAVHVPGRADPAGLVGEVFTFVVEGVPVVAAVDEETTQAPSPGQDAPRPDVGHEARRCQGVLKQVGYVRGAPGHSGRAMGSARISAPVGASR